MTRTRAASRSRSPRCSAVRRTPRPQPHPHTRPIAPQRARRLLRSAPPQQQPFPTRSTPAMDKHAEAQAARSVSQEGAEAVLPRYSSTSTASLGPELSEHSFQLDDSKGRPWLWLTVKSRAKDKKTWPLYYERDIIHGTVEVDFDKTDGAKAVAVSVSGGVTAVGQEELTFLTISEDLWDSKVSGKAPKGKASWPFSLTLPAETPASNKPKGRAELYRLPPTFTERASPVYIDYKLTATVRRGTFKVNQILTASIFYTPLSRAEPPSQLRLAAYNAGAPLVGPSGDPPGWKVLPPVQFTGTLFNQRTVTVECSVAIAAPLSFATGSPIPLFLTFTCADEQALDLLCAPSAVRLQLVRERLLGSQATQEGAGQSSNTFREPMAGAYFWPSHDGAVAQGRRQLQGEIDIKKSLRPTFVFPRFSLRYFICMFPCQAPGYVAASPDTPLFTEAVTVHTMNAIGVSPKSYAPPGYAQSMEGNYNNVAGYLENGNQRFYHHGGFQ